MRKIWIEDTTLRDGEQSPDVRFTPDEKLRIAKQLEKLGVDVIECGFPITSQGDFDAVRLLGEHLKDTWLRPIARTAKPDVDSAYEAVKLAAKPRVAVFSSASALHIHHKMRSTEAEVLKNSADFVRYARQKGVPVDFAAEDGTRADIGFLTDLFRAVHEAGAEFIMLCDTVGYATPKEFYDIVCHLKNNIPGIRLSAHCHDDLGLAVANTLAGIEAGCEMVETTINGIGERAGNAPLEEVVMALKVRQQFYNVDVSHINTPELYETSRMIAELSGVRISQNKAIIGDSAFRHESGIHQDGVLKNPMTYHVMTAEDVGQELNPLVLGKHSGRHAFIKKLEKLGVELPQDKVVECFKAFKDLCDQQKVVTDADIAALASRYAATEAAR